MFRIDTPDATPDNRFTEGNPTIPIEATTVSADWLNSIQEELMSILEHVNLQPNKSSTTQVYEAIKTIIAERIPVATPTKKGIVQPDGTTVTINEQGILSVAQLIAEFKDFFEKIPPEGWAVRDGSVLTAADITYPKLWEHLSSPNNIWKTKSQAEWTALSTAAGGIGGVPFFVLDNATKTIKLPDTRTDHSFGLTSADIGIWQNDAIRNIVGGIGGYFDFVQAAGPFYQNNHASGVQSVNFSAAGYHNFTFDTSRVVPTASQVRPRRFALLPCVYIGGTR